MSFILDALKKSEADRQEKASPGIADVATANAPGSAPRWLWIVFALLGINLVVLMAVLPRPSEVEVEPSIPTTAAAEPRTAETRRAQPVIAEATPAPVETPADEPVQAAVAEAAPDTVGDDSSAAAEAASSVPPQLPELESQTLLTFNDLRASGNVNLPDLHIDLHVYSDNPAERFVFINMNQYRERATLSEGPRVQRITTEGVILEYVGTTFLLPRE